MKTAVGDAGHDRIRQSRLAWIAEVLRRPLRRPFHTTLTTDPDQGGTTT